MDDDAKWIFQTKTDITLSKKPLSNNNTVGSNEKCSRLSHHIVQQNHSLGPLMFQSQTVRAGFAFLHPSTALSITTVTDIQINN